MGRRRGGGREEAKKDEKKRSCKIVETRAEVEGKVDPYIGPQSPFRKYPFLKSLFPKSPRQQRARDWEGRGEEGRVWCFKCLDFYLVSEGEVVTGGGPRRKGIIIFRPGEDSSVFFLILLFVDYRSRFKKHPNSQLDIVILIEGRCFVSVSMYLLSIS